MKSKENKLRQFDERTKRGKEIPEPVLLSKRYTLGEEIFNSVSHGTGGLLAIAGTVVLIVFCAIYADAWSVVSSCIYGASLII